MDTKAFKKLAKNVVKGIEAGRTSDPRFYQSLTTLPNCDPILRAMGYADEAYNAIMSDAHVIGELRSIRAGLLSYKTRVVAGDNADDSPLQKLALELCQRVMKKRPADGMTWSDVIWNMATAVLRGFRVHELDWQITEDSYLLPVQVLDRPNRRFKFDIDNKLRLLTKSDPLYGEETEDYKYLISRHMPSTDEPYGKALLSTCFWPYTFKHGGFKFFYQFCERFGMPWPVGKYAKGATVPEQNELLDALLEMLSSGAAVIPEGDEVDLVSFQGSSNTLVQEALINLCNAEMSKALTSQTLATEMKNVGSNAASKTHREREESVNDSDRRIIESTINEMFSYITLFNCGKDVIPPVFQIYESKLATKDRADIWDIATRIGNPSKAAFHKEMGIPMAIDANDTMNSNATIASSQFSRPLSTYNFVQKDAKSIEDIAIEDADKVIESDLLEPAFAMLSEYERQGKSLQNFLDDLPKLFSKMDAKELNSLSSQVMQVAFSEGVDNA